MKLTGPEPEYIGSQFITFSLALYVGLRIWRKSARGKWLMNFQRNNKYSWVVYPVILLLGSAITYLAISILGYWPRVLIEFILVIGIIYYTLREFKRFLI
ncbi:hypothetical protein MNBD_ALPHA01-1249 [hydrothermal vent metagenome]|uniref:Uncharacterized protein n=1 Tax=hydrothermal vent metagenome TaxID=652676 RepID=A0A3B0SYS4_9ZZZZ